MILLLTHQTHDDARSEIFDYIEVFHTIVLFIVQNFPLTFSEPSVVQVAPAFCEHY